MTVNIKKLSDLERELQFTIPAQEVERAYQKRLQKESRKPSFKLQGSFRPGTKATQDYINQHFGKPILNEACFELIDQLYRETIQEQKLLTVGQPRLQGEPQFKRNEDAHCTLIVETFPDIKLNGLSGESIELLTGHIAPEDVERELEKLRGEQKTWKAVARAAENGDQVNVDFEAYDENQESIPNGSAQKFDLVLGSGSMIPGFEEQFIGLKAGDSKEFKLVFPEDYHAKALAGKLALFKVTVNEVRTADVLEDEALLKKIGFQKGGIAELKTDIRKFLENQLAQFQEEERRMAVFNRLLERNPVNVPKAAVQAEVEGLKNAARERIRQQFPNVSDDILKSLPLPEGQYVGEATRRVKLGVLLSTAIKDFKIERDEQKVQQKLQEMVAQSPNPQQMMAAYQRNPRWLENVEELVLEQAVVARLLEDVKVTEKNVGFDVFMKHREERIATDKFNMASQPHAEEPHVHGPDCNHEQHAGDHHNHEAEKRKHDAQNRGLSPKYTDHSRPIHHGHSDHNKKGEK